MRNSSRKLLDFDFSALNPDTKLNQAQLAALLVVTTQSVQKDFKACLQFHKIEWVPKKTVLTIAQLVSYINHCKTVDDKTAKQDEISNIKMQTAIQKLKKDFAATEKLEIENNVRKGELIEQSKVKNWQSALANVVSAKLEFLRSDLCVKLEGKSLPEIMQIMDEQCNDLISTILDAKI